MKRMLPLLMVLILLSSASLGFAEEAKAGWMERLTTALDSLQKGVGETEEKATEIITEKAGQLSEKVTGALATATEKAEEAAAFLGNAKETVTPYVEQAKDTVPGKLKELSEQVSNILASVKNSADKVQDVVVQKAGEIAQNPDGIAQAAKEKVLNALNSTWKSAIDKLKGLVDWLKGGNQSTVAVIPQASTINTSSVSTDTTNQKAAQPFYPLSGYGFYFGMPWKEAKALNTNWLNDSRANTYPRARALVMLDQKGTSLYFLWFAGDTEDAPLLEVDEFAFTAQDTLVPPQGANGQYSFITTDATVKQVYAEKELSCGQRFGSPSSLESGLLVSSLMFDENDAGISQAQVYLLQNQENEIIATHFVYTTDCGVNVMIYQYT